jgi:hypothetical protein
LTACSGLPALRDSSSASSSACSSIASASLSRASERVAGVAFDQPSKAARAALTARSMSSDVLSGGVEHVAGAPLGGRYGLAVDEVIEGLSPGLGGGHLSS